MRVSRAEESAPLQLSPIESAGDIGATRMMGKYPDRAFAPYVLGSACMCKPEFLLPRRVLTAHNQWDPLTNLPIYQIHLMC